MSSFFLWAQSPNKYCYDNMSLGNICFITSNARLVTEIKVESIVNYCIWRDRVCVWEREWQRERECVCIRGSVCEYGGLDLSTKKLWSKYILWFSKLYTPTTVGAPVFLLALSHSCPSPLALVHLPDLAPRSASCPVYFSLPVLSQFAYSEPC